jgi:hypothetical protein
VLRSTPDPDGDGSGNFQSGWSDYLGPVAGRIEPLVAGGEDQREGQVASRQRFVIHLRATPVSRRIDARDRVEEVGGSSRAFNVLANMTEPKDPMARLMVEQTPVTSPPTEVVSEYETEGEPLFPVGP